MKKATNLDDLIPGEWLLDKNGNWWEIYKEIDGDGLYAMNAVETCEAITLDEDSLKNFDYTLTASDLIWGIIPYYIRKQDKRRNNNDQPRKLKKR